MYYISFFMNSQRIVMADVTHNLLHKKYIMEWGSHDCDIVACRCLFFRCVVSNFVLHGDSNYCLKLKGFKKLRRL